MNIINFIIAFSVLLMYAISPACGVEDYGDVNISLIKKEAEQRELPVRPGSSFKNRVGYFINDKIVGERLYYANGNLMEENVFGDLGKENMNRAWYENGKLRLLVPYKAGKVDGTAKQWGPNGQLLGVYQMIRGTGIEITWNENGMRSEIVSFVDGKRNGLNIKYFSNGEIQTVESYVDNLKDGPSYIFYPSRLVMQFVSYKKGMAVGPLLIKDEAGSLISDTPIWYLYDKIVSREEYIESSEKDPSLPKVDSNLPE